MFLQAKDEPLFTRFVPYMDKAGIFYDFYRTHMRFFYAVEGSLKEYPFSNSSDQLPVNDCIRQAVQVYFYFFGPLFSWLFCLHAFLQLSLDGHEVL